MTVIDEWTKNKMNETMNFRLIDSWAVIGETLFSPGQPMWNF